VLVYEVDGAVTDSERGDLTAVLDELNLDAFPDGGVRLLGLDTYLLQYDATGLSRTLQVPGARLVAERSGPLALLSAVESPTVPFRHAPGLSIQSPALPPLQLGVFLDGDALTTIDAYDGRPGQPAYLGHTTDALAYALKARPEVLVLGVGGGRGVLQAVAHGAARVDAVEVNPDMVRLVREDFSTFAGRLYERPEVAVHTGEPRHFLAATEGAWDVIQLPLGGDGTAAGGQGLAESYLVTVEALALCRERLRPGGWLSVTGPLRLPPANALRLAATALQAWRGGEANPTTSLVLIRGMTAFTLLMKRGPVSREEIAALKTFARQNAFDLAWYPGMVRGEANRFNVLASPEFFDGIAALAGPGRDAFITGYKFDIRPATDDRPFFHDVSRWRTLPELVALRFQGGAPLLEWGGIIVSATVAQALVLGLLLILLPLRLGAYRRKARRTKWRIADYFLALGLAFLFVEIAFIQTFTLFLGHPVQAVAVVLTGFLVFAGLGAGASERIERRLGTPGAIAAAVACIVVVAVLYLALLPDLFERLAGLPGMMRASLSLVLIAPLAFPMGMPFPLGLARIARSEPEFVPWAWGLNGCASVVSAAGAKLLAMQVGFTATVIAALILYAAAAWAFRGTRPAG
jgi:spermidine synthase